MSALGLLVVAVLGSAPDALDVSSWPAEKQAQYRVFAVRCSKCHSLARPLSARMTPEGWRAYVKKMTRRSGSGINEEAAEAILGFLTTNLVKGAAAPPAGTPPQETAPAPKAPTQAPETLLPLVLRALTYDRTLPDRGTGPFVVAVAFDGAQRTRAGEFMAAVDPTTLPALRNRTVRLLELELTDPAEFRRLVAEKNVQAVLVLPGLAPSTLSWVCAATQELKRYGLALTPEQAPNAVVAIEANGAKPRLVVNASRASAVGAEFDRTLLQVSRVVVDEESGGDRLRAGQANARRDAGTTPLP